ncbi:WD repeat-containing protein [Actinidia chinensis var. chinensis]|uniref:WD repeat-containing protein n=1 Tax=Actinidia chinensis var. chinensis TaxID=1590841 RepID=A0A2R6QJA2_ACTCC|nr:WD repeat-containing protein [Actinidia chinensis var. chinensis]
MASFRPFFSNFLSLFLLHLGCFIFTTNSHHHHHLSKKRRASPLSHSSPSLKHKTRKALSSSWSFLKRILTRTQTHPNPNLNPTTTLSTRSSSVVSIVTPETLDFDPPRTRPTGSRPESDISSDPQFPLRNDIYPCPACGEIFQKPNLLEQHQTIRHAVMELNDWDSGKNIVQIIFNTGWPEKAKDPKIHRVLKIHNSPIILTRFEEYRESVKLRAARNGVVRRRDERCLADGNELLRFYCATFLCELGQNGNSSICNHQFCGACGIIGSGFSPKMDGISTLSTGFRAHVAVPADIEEEFGFMGVKRAMLVCRVIAGRVGCDPDYVDKEDPGFDSVVGKGPGARMRLDEEDELLVFNPRAVLPCFVIVYTV